METFDLVNIVIVGGLGVALVAAAVLHHRALKRAVLSADKRHVRGLRRYRS